MIRTSVIIVVAFALAASLQVATAQDKIVTAEETLEGRITKTQSDGSPVIEIPGKGVRAVARAQIVRIEMPEPAEMAKARGAAPDAVLAAIGAKIEGLIGLEVPWVKEGMGLVTEAYLAQGKKAEAKKIFDQAEKAYKGTPDEMLANVGKARMAIADKNFSEAEAALAPVIEKAKASVMPPVAEMGLVATAFYTLGQVYEAQKKNNEAMECYAKVGGLYSASPDLVRRSAERMKNLRETAKAFVP